VNLPEQWPGRTYSGVRSCNSQRVVEAPRSTKPNLGRMSLPDVPGEVLGLAKGGKNFAPFSSPWALCSISVVLNHPDCDVANMSAQDIGETEAQ
jgi:hypothetical protein